MRQLFISAVVFIFWIATQSTQTIQASTFDHLIKASDYRDVKISPDGQHMAVVFDNDDQIRIYIFDLKSMKMIGNHGLGKYTPFGLFWANNERVVVRVGYESIRYIGKFDSGVLYSVDKTGKQGKYLQAVDSVIDRLPLDEKHILVSIDDDVYKLNIYNNETRKVARSPELHSWDRYLTNGLGELMAVHTINAKREQELYFKDQAGQWQKNSELDLGTSFGLLSSNPEGTEIAFYNNADTPTVSLYRYHIERKELTRLFAHSEFDVLGVTFDATSNLPLAVELAPDYPAYALLDENGAWAEGLKYLYQYFAGNSVEITSSDDQHQLAIVKVVNDISPGDYFLFRIADKQLTPVLQVSQQLNRKLMAYTDAFSFEASDKTSLKGFITYPKSTSNPVPMIVLVHGGPIGVRDDGLFDSEVQLLVEQGYAVMQVNYRGSSGRGDDFEIAGQKHWGDLIQQDIYEAAQFIISQGKIDRNKVCIMGSSFGAYSAIQSGTLYPDFYRCLIANAGVYDLTVLKDRLSGKAMRDRMSELVGEDKTFLAAQSPTNYIEKIKAPIFLSHGTKDSIAPIEHAEKLIEVLKLKQKKFEYLEFSREMHGLKSEKNRREYYQALFKFLEKNLKQL